MIIIKDKKFSKDSDFEKDIKEIDKKKGKRNKLLKIALLPSEQATKGNIIEAATSGALLGGSASILSHGINKGTSVIIGSIRAKKKGLPIKKYTGKYIKLINNKRKQKPLLESIKHSAERQAIIHGGTAMAINIGKQSSDKFKNKMDKESDINNVRSGKMSKEDFIKKYYGEEYLNRLKYDNTKK